MAAFISSIDTGFLTLWRNSPFSSCTERVAAIMVNCPFSISTNSTRSPASSPSAERTLAGIVIWPFEVTVALAMYSPCAMHISLHYGKELSGPCQVKNLDASALQHGAGTPNVAFLAIQ